MHARRNNFRTSPSDLALAWVWLSRATRAGRSALYAFRREAADVTEDEFAPVEQRRDHLNTGSVDEADEETTLSAGKDITP